MLFRSLLELGVIIFLIWGYAHEAEFVRVERAIAKLFTKEGRKLFKEIMWE